MKRYNRITRKARTCESKRGFSNESRKSKDWLGVPGARFIYHGDWSDPEIVYNGFSLNYYDIEAPLLDSYREENADDRNDKGFDAWLEKQDPKWIQGILDDSVYADYGDQMEKAKDWLGIKGAYLLQDIKTGDEFVMYDGKRIELDDLAMEIGYDDANDPDYLEFIHVITRKLNPKYNSAKKSRDEKNMYRRTVVTALNSCASKMFSEGTEEEVLAMPGRKQEIEDELLNNKQKLYNMLADEWLDNDLPFEDLLYQRDMLVKELCSCQNLVKESAIGPDKSVRDEIRDIVGDDRADEMFEYWRRINYGFNSAWRAADGFYGDCFEHLDRFEQMIGPEGKDIVDRIKEKYARAHRELCDYYSSHSYTGD